VAREIVRRANGDNTRFELRLDPPELGKIQVQLDVSRDHKVTAVVSADNPQALSDLTRGARDLQQALQSAGLQLADDGLSFNLSNQNHGFSQPDQSNTNSGNPGGAQRGLTAENQSSADTSSARARPLSIESWRGARIDVMA
jgi:flagellar hook-length control protein FliK